MTLLLCLAAIPRLRDLAPGVDAGRRVVAITVVALAASAAALTFPGERILYSLTGIAHIGDLVGRALLMVTAVATQCIFLFAVEPDQHPRPRLRRRVAALIAALVLLVSVFTAAPGRDASADYLVVYGAEPLVAIFVVTFTAFLGWCFADVLAAWSRLKRRTSGTLHAGLHTLAAGAGVGLGYVLLRLIGEVALFADRPGVVAATRIGCLITGSVASLLAVTAVSWPAASALTSSLHEWSQARQQLRQLFPLWRDLADVAPQVALEQPRSPAREALAVRDVRWRLYRRVIEIHDARLALRPYVRPLGASATTPEAAEAHRLADAITAARIGVAPEVAPVRSTGGPSETTVADDVSREAEWLTGVAREYTALIRTGRDRAVYSRAAA
ncbi:MAB_1171c family putative transporter [Kineococcus indalonis]|uniref:MAB_1171c family putative transporter n=1 Tax=Kineococcus indalonis TaxID=2696566 RepID=UPI0014127D53|nr:MAB_1171c family putative transporter [Kineococcus indalonis]